VDLKDFWFLDAAAEFMLPMDWPCAPNVGEILSRKSHGLSGDEVARRMRRLLDSGLISIFARESGEPLSPPSDGELAAMLNPPPDKVARPHYFAGFAYGLTPTGGLEWEKIAEPDWSRFHGIAYGIDPDECVMEAAGEARLFEAISHTGLGRERFRWDPREIEFTLLEPWRPVYWKELPRGWRAEYPLIRLGGEDRPCEPERQMALDRYWEFARWKSRPGDPADRAARK